MTSDPADSRSPSKSMDSTAAAPSPRRFSLRGFTSLLLTLAFLAMCLSGAMLFVTPRGRTANWTDWTMMALDKHQWGAVHVSNSVLFVSIAALHLLLNWSVFMRYLKKKATSGLHMKKELALAMVVALVCVAGPITDLPPFSNLMALNEDIKNYWEQHAEAPPVPHAEELTLAELASTIDLSVEQVSAALQEEGYDVQDASQTVGDVGRQKDVAPNAVFDAIRQKYPDTRGWGRVNGRGGAAGHGASGGGRGGQADHAGAGGGPAGGAGQGPGWGRGQGRGSEQNAGDLPDLTLTAVAQAIAVAEEELVAALVVAGFDLSDTSATLGQLAAQQSMTPQQVLDVLREALPDTRGWGRLTGQRGGGWH